ncbi:glycosyltransferase family 4 protein [Fodinibius sp. Rm-B-1B1-1]|uniref:glycosyltransferase family 4 protein n=1 Tax=Fodinibius alkaliphilus TaxID=3140241 RepID=UPI00315B28DA
MKDKYLIIGKRVPTNERSNVGGVIVLFEQLLEDLQRNNFKHEVIDINYRNYGNKIKAYLLIHWQILCKIWSSDKVLLNGDNNLIYLYAPFLLIWSLIGGQKVIFRFFGGNFHNYYEQKNILLRCIFLLQLRKADLVFWEQHYQVNYFKDKQINAHWFPNVRSITDESLIHDQERDFKGKFVFISHIREEKGVNAILKVKCELGSNFDIHLYGPELNYECPQQLKPIYKNIYKGAIEPENVLQVLSEYDVLVLPTFWSGEGYPGIIIEAFGLGIPVIATDLMGIKEMFEKDAGILIEPRSVLELKQAIEEINQSNYSKLIAGAKEAFKSFNAEVQMPAILKKIKNI